VFTKWWNLGCEPRDFHEQYDRLAKSLPGAPFFQVLCQRCSAMQWLLSLCPSEWSAHIGCGLHIGPTSLEPTLHSTSCASILTSRFAAHAVGTHRLRLGSLLPKAYCQTIAYTGLCYRRGLSHDEAGPAPPRAMLFPSIQGFINPVRKH